MAMLVMIPLNVLVFGLDNLIFLLYPYRVQQEGLEIFLRTMLTFTGKGLLFTVGLVAMSAWGFAAAALTRGIVPLDRIRHQCVRRVHWRHDRRNILIGGTRALRIISNLSQHEPD